MIEIIGAGSMGTAIANGLHSSGIVESELRVIRRNELPDANAQVTIIAVRRPDLADVCKSLSNSKPHVVISVVAGIELQTLEQMMGSEHELVRAMPNLPVSICRGQTAVAFQDSPNKSVLELFQRLGDTLVVDEPTMHSFTALFGAGPGYVARIATAYEKTAIEFGFEKVVVQRLVANLIAGSASLLAAEGGAGANFEDFMTDVARPGGTTEKGLNVLDNFQLDSIIAKSVAAAKAHSEEIADTSSQIRRHP